jgi:hypothetical protein
MRAFLVRLGLLVAVTASLQGQTLVGVNSRATTPVYLIDAATGGARFLGPANLATFSVGLSTIDRAGRRLFLFDSTGPIRLVTFNVATGVANSVNIAQTVRAEYDPSLGRVIGVAGDPARTIFALDPATGTSTPLLATNVPSLLSPSSAFDPVTRRYFFEGTTGPNDQVITANLNTNTVTSVNVSQSFTFFGYDPATGRLIGTVSAAPSVTVASLDPVTGLVTTLFASGVTTAAAGSATYDPIGRVFYFIDGSNNLVEMNLNTSKTAIVGQQAPGIALLEPDSINGSLPSLSPFLLALLAGALALTGLYVTSRRSLS